jgi:DHA1 family bicyclomycin/chloramphenicol resistance-like MFS transporter
MRGITLTIFLGALAALPPLGIDMGLPALPLLQTGLGASPAQAGMTLSLFLLGFAFAPLLLGPLADRFGRRPVLIGGLVLFAAAGLACGAAESIHILLVLRFVQGAGAGAGAVLPMVIVRDLFEGSAAQRQVSRVTAVQGIAPAIAPILGTLMLGLDGWRAIFIVLGAGGVTLLLAALFGFRESARIRSPSLRPSRLVRTYGEVLRHPVCRGYALVQAFGFACMFSYVSGAPLVIMGVYHLPAVAFSALFACTAVSIICGSLVNGQLAARRVPSSRVLTSGLSLMLLSAGMAAVLAFGGTATLPLLMVAMVVNTFSFGLIAPLAWHQALQPLPRIAGVVSAVVGSLQMLVGAGASALVASLFDGISSRSLTSVMLVCALAASAAGWSVLRVGRRGTMAAERLGGAPVGDTAGE